MNTKRYFMKYNDNIAISAMCFFCRATLKYKFSDISPDD